MAIGNRVRGQLEVPLAANACDTCLLLIVPLGNFTVSALVALLNE